MLIYIDRKTVEAKSALLADSNTQAAKSMESLTCVSDDIKAEWTGSLAAFFQKRLSGYVDSVATINQSIDDIKKKIDSCTENYKATEDSTLELLGKISDIFSRTIISITNNGEGS